ncbi:hypothetical protein XELAEV_18000013mg [Xenopus laevis]|uniref:GIY-YIG domain-containing protein n=1 Tax=Xenopus laevis TaxID=8355 RepID=A0A974BR81_XENLA|nr:hypothetical protein XELAEV_18000013mg [Xenopus laevis]
MTFKFQERGYPLLKEQRSQVEDPERSQNNLSKPKREGGRLTFVSKYNSMSSHITKIVHKHWGLLRDGIPNCGEVIYHSHKGTPIKIKGHFTCSSTFVVYVIKCPSGLQYVGQTSRMVKDRIRKHKSAIKTKKIEQAVACHFNEKGHGVLQLKYQVVDGVPILHRRGDRLKQLLKMEAM